MKKSFILSGFVALVTLGSAAVLPRTSLAMPVAPAISQTGSETGSIDLVAYRRVVRHYGHGYGHYGHAYHRYGHAYHRYGHSYYYGGYGHPYYYGGYGYPSYYGGYGYPYAYPGVYVGFPFVGFG